MEGTVESLNNEQQFKYVAFISYSSKDTEWGKRVQHKLEHYRMPSTMCREHGWNRKPINHPTRRNPIGWARKSSFSIIWAGLVTFISLS